MTARILELEPVYEGILIERVGRFVVRVDLNGRTVLAHNTNTGRLLDVLVPGRRVLLVPAGGKLGLRLVGVEDGLLAGCFNVVDVITQGKAFERAVELGLLPYFLGCRVVGRSPRLGDVRLDYELDCGEERVLVETKSAVMRGPEGEAMYPDCETLRGRRQMVALADAVLSGRKVYIVFVAALCGARFFRLNEAGDRVVYSLVRDAAEKGVALRSMSIHLGEDGSVYLDEPDLPVRL